MTFGEQQPVVAGVLHQASAGLDEALLHAGERPAVDARRQHEPPLEIPEVVGHHAQLEAHFVGPEPMTVRRNVGSVDRRTASLRSSYPANRL